MVGLAELNNGFGRTKEGLGQPCFEYLGAESITGKLTDGTVVFAEVWMMERQYYAVIFQLKAGGIGKRPDIGDRNEGKQIFQHAVNVSQKWNLVPNPHRPTVTRRNISENIVLNS